MASGYTKTTGDFGSLGAIRRIVVLMMETARLTTCSATSA
jgi:hypothetical protein